MDEWDKRTRLAHEREMLGLYVSDHPLNGLELVLDRERHISIGALLAEDGPRDGVTAIAGMITSVTRKTTKRGDIWAIVTIEDLEASIDVLLFPRVYELVSTVLETDTIVRVLGKITIKEEAVEIHANELTTLDVSNETADQPIVISLPAQRCTPTIVEDLRSVLLSHPGRTEVRLKLKSPDKSILMRVGGDLFVTVSVDLMGDLKALLGPSSISTPSGPPTSSAQTRRT
ncbi:MAG TPA: OB-fold nucleic acid binding domain-containing protein [Microlunatus sp.]